MPETTGIPLATIAVGVHHRATGGDKDKGDDKQGAGQGSDDEASGVIHAAPRSPLAGGLRNYLRDSMHELFLASKLNVLLLTVPVALIGIAADWGAGLVFILCLIGLCPLAERIAFVTEDLAKCTNDTLGGLINATMGNITELIVSVVALNSGLLRVVQVSLVGSIFSNLLLVMGCAFLAGGIKHTTQTFSKHAANANSGVMLLAVMALLLPSVLDATHDEASVSGVLEFSRLTAVAMLITYACLVVYQLRTHRHIFEPSPPPSPSSAGARPAGQAVEDEEDDDDEGPSVFGLWGAIFWLSVITVLIAILSDAIVDTIEEAAGDLGMPLLFIGTILLPIVGNAAEHAAAVIFCWKNKPDLAMGIAAGSATQIATFVIPFCVIVGWMIGQPLDLDFHVFETSCLLITVIIFALLAQAGESDWLRGAMLLCAYFVLSVGFWVHRDPAAEAPGGIFARAEAPGGISAPGAETPQGIAQ